MKKKYNKKDIDAALRFTKNEKNRTMQSFGFWDKLKYLFSNPNLFFEKIKGEKGITNALLAFLIIVLSADVVGYGMAYSIGLMMPYGNFFYGFPSSYLFGFYGLSYFLAIFGFLLSLLISIIYSGIIHAIVIAFKGEGTFSDTYKVYAYSVIPFQILSLIPIIGLFSIIYSFILMVIGVSKLHNISKGKSALACLMPLIFVLGILVLLVFMYLGLIFRRFY